MGVIIIVSPKTAGINACKNGNSLRTLPGLMTALSYYYLPEKLWNPEQST